MSKPTDISAERIKFNDRYYVPEESVATAVAASGPEVIIRTDTAGVFVGVLEEEWKTAGQVVTLKNARRIWRWRGANTLSEISMSGVNRKEYTRISTSVPSQKLVPTEVIPVMAGVDLSPVWNA